MDLFSHAASGVCLGVAAGLLRGKTDSRTTLLLTLGTVAPDIDGLTVLFDHGTYYAQHWYSHHGALHSPVAALAAFVGFQALSRLIFRPRRAFPAGRLAFLVGWLLHLIEDLPSPPEPWGGLPLLWPFRDTRYGGWAHIWWLNEYLLFVLVSAAMLALVGVAIVRHTPPRFARVISLLTFTAALTALTQATIFAAVSRYESIPQWNAYQRLLLGDRLWSPVYRIDHALNFLWEHEVIPRTGGHAPLLPTHARAGMTSTMTTWLPGFHISPPGLSTSIPTNPSNNLFPENP